MASTWVMASNNWWGTYSPSTVLYTDNQPIQVNIATNLPSQNQIINTPYWQVSKTILSTWTVIKLLDLSIYIDRSKPVQNEFSDIKNIQDKNIESMPKVGVDMTDAYILAMTTIIKK